MYDRPIESPEKRLPSRGTGQQALDIRGPAGRERNGIVNRVFLREMTNPDRTADAAVPGTWFDTFVKTGARKIKVLGPPIVVALFFSCRRPGDV